MVIILRGILSVIDKYKVLHFVYLKDDTESREAVMAAMPSDAVEGLYHFPYDDAGFKMKFAGDVELLRPYIGLRCEIIARTKAYRFTSKLAANKGEEVRGMHLLFEDIRPLKE